MDTLLRQCERHRLCCESRRVTLTCGGFCATLSLLQQCRYNSKLFEDQNQNRMSECFAVFKDTVNNPLFAETPVYLLFNKKDLFEQLIKRDPLTKCPAFADYAGIPSPRRFHAPIAHLLIAR